MTQKTKQSAKKADKTQEKMEFDKPLFQKGGTYFHAGAIIGRKNVFVTNEYIDLLVNAIKTAELKMDIKNLAYVVMPNFFYWMFRLNDNTDNPVKVYGEVKKQVAMELLNNLKEEVNEKEYKLPKIFEKNDRIGRSKPEKILWTFEEYGKKFTTCKRYRVWAPKTEIRLLDTEELIQQKLETVMKAPCSERWQLAEEPGAYPYFYVADELVDKGSLVQDIIDNFQSTLPTATAQAIV